MKKTYLLLALLLGVALHAQSAQFTCSNAQSVVITGTTAQGSVQLVPAPALGRNANIFMCSYNVQATQGGTAATVQLTAGTGTNCGTNNTPLTVAAISAANSQTSLKADFTSDSAQQVPTNSAVCLTLGGAVAASSVQIRYVRY